MIHYLGLLLLVGILVSGVYLYVKVARLNREIAEQMEETGPEAGDGQ